MHSLKLTLHRIRVRISPSYRDAYLRQTALFLGHTGPLSTLPYQPAPLLSESFTAWVRSL